MTSIASSIQPREPAIREERSWRVVLVGQSLAKRDWDAAPDWTVGIGGDCTFEGLPKAARSLDFRALRAYWAETEKHCSRQACLLRSAAILGFLLRRYRWHFAARVVQKWEERRFARSAARLKGLPLRLLQRQREELWHQRHRDWKKTLRDYSATSWDGSPD